MEHCSSVSLSDHGDARRALDLLRTAGEICDGVITKSDIDSAQKLLQKDRAQEIVSAAPFHMRCVAAAVCSLAIINQESWSATSSVYKKYSDISSKNSNPLSYRRVSDLLVELENSGLLVSRAYSRGRNGYGKEYKLKVSPELVGPSIDKEWFDSILSIRASRDRVKRMEKLMKPSQRFGRYSNLFSD